MKLEALIPAPADGEVWPVIMFLNAQSLAPIEIHHTDLIFKQINMEGGQSYTYLRLTRASSGPWVSVAKTYRDENETVSCILLLRKATVIWPKY